MLAFPATVHAAASIQLDSERAAVGSSVGISGQGFYRFQVMYIYMSPTDAEAGLDRVRDLDVFHRVGGRYTDVNGAFSGSFVIPPRLTDGDKDEDVHGGEYYFYVTETPETTIEAKAKLTVAGIDKVSHTKGPVGTEVRIEGSGYEGGEGIDVFFDGRDVDITSGDTSTDTGGEFDFTIEIPDGIAGEHTIVVEEDSGLRGVTKFTIEPEITVTPSSASDWDTVTVKGTGFGYMLRVNIYFDGVEQILASTITSEYGSYTTMLNISFKRPGRYSVKAIDEYNNEARADLTISAGVMVSPTTGNVGSQVTISGTGFTVNADVTITYAADEAAATHAIVDRLGRFTITFAVPASKYGSHIITATDGTRTADTTFTMESDKPAAPLLVAPETGMEVESGAIFDWNDVDDPSGVTYDLEIATSQKFTPGSVVLHRTALKESGYTLAEEVPLKSTKQEKPYYWRVRAIDGASNEGQWTEPRPFYVASTFELTGWVLYTLIGLAGLFILFIGSLLVRRMVY